MNMNTRLCLIKSRGDTVEATPETSENGFCHPSPRVHPTFLLSKQPTANYSAAEFPQKPSLVFFFLIFLYLFPSLTPRWRYTDRLAWDGHIRIQSHHFTLFSLTHITIRTIPICGRKPYTETIV